MSPAPKGAATKDVSGGGGRLSEVEVAALDDLMANLESEVGDVYDDAPTIEADEDAYWAYHSWHAVMKLRGFASRAALLQAMPAALSEQQS